MQPCATKLAIRVKGDIHEVVSCNVERHQDSIKKEEPIDILDNAPPPKIYNISGNENVIDLSSSECSSSNDDDENNSKKQLVVYDPNNSGGGVAIDPISYKPPPRRLPSVGAFTVQCANCFKWRLIPSQEKYEEIRQHITDKPFVCEAAHEWRPHVSCHDPPDIEQDGTRLWAIDKPNIAQPPPGWQRDLRIRGQGSTKFADVYYTAPTGTKLRSIPDVDKYLFKHPEYVEQGVTLAQFSFQIPKPLQDNYVRKRPAPLRQAAKAMAALPGPEQNTDLQLGLPGFSARYMFAPVVKRARSAPGKRRENFDLMLQHPQM